MYLCISGFLRSVNEDDSLKFDFDLDEHLNDQIVRILGHRSLNAMSEGEWLLTKEQVIELSQIIGESLPTDLDLYIGVLA
ncbi:pyocin S6 family toxin immunity protein [Pseudomonas fluorescens]|uniref:pyocin S6 family toxin immunity protein n=1 Tax=Pseudomonas fluorescens TaxID=294 RepID=UPI0004BE24FD|nr:pyocin S6 family toxin immunity protein [Pseudomonas fluorescens]